MAGLSYADTELRKLPPSFRLKIAQLLDVNDSWKKLMALIPSDLNNMETSKPKYSTEHIELIERYARNASRLGSEILLDEWSTSGKVRPTVEILFQLLQKCQLFRAADYVASEILGVPLPPRPNAGPAKLIRQLESVNINLENRLQASTASDVSDQENAPLQALLQELNNYDYSNGNLINFNIEILEKLTNNFHESYSIGSGAFGTVYVLDLQRNGPKLAAKLLNLSTSLAEEQFVTEIKTLSTYRHENLLSLVGFCTNGPKFCLVYEFMSNGSLLDVLSNWDRATRLNWHKRILILHGVANGINYLHTGQDKPLIHRDIKSANVLLNEQYTPKIGDFGLAKSLSSGNQTSALTSTIFGSSAYMSPEAFRGDISPKMDIFSFGVIVMEVLTGLSPYDETREGNDLVTYLEEIVEDDDITPFVDSRADQISSVHANTIYKVGQQCFLDKKRRPTAEQLAKEFVPLTAVFI